MALASFANTAHPDEDGEEGSGGLRQVNVRVEQVLVQQRVAEGRQSGENSRQLQVQLVRLQTQHYQHLHRWVTTKGGGLCTGVYVPAPGYVPDG